MKKILIVEELRPILEMEQSILKRTGLEIFTASSGEEALRIHAAEKVNLVITALEMEGMAGDELCRAIRRDDGLKQVSLLIVCNKRKADIERCAGSGANTYITRPIDPAELRAAVEKLIDVPHRKSLRVLIRVSVKGHFKSEPFFCTSENISRSGILIEAERALAKGDLISCSFFIPDEDRVIADCEVVRVERKKGQSYYYGVQFVNIDSRHEDSIDKFVQKRLLAARGGQETAR